MTEMNEFVTRENIRRLKAQLLVAAVGARRTTMRELLEDEELRLQHLLAGQG